MHAIVYHGPEDFRYETTPDPTLREPTDAIVRVTRSAICGSDLHLWHGMPTPDRGFAVGHEFVGVVEEVGAEVHGVAPGERVLAACTTGCGRCAACRRGLTSGCRVTTQDGRQNVFGFSAALPGGQAEAVRVHFADANLFRIPEALSDEQVLFLTDALPTGYMGADLAGVGAGDTVLVFGAGAVGTFAARAATLRGAARVAVVDLDEGRLAGARARGLLAFHGERDDLEGALRDWTDGQGADAVIEAVGRPELILRGMALARPGACIAGIGVSLQPVEVPWMLLMAKSQTLRSGLVNPQPYIPRLMPLVACGRLDPTEVITHRLPLREGVRGYRTFEARAEGVLKVVLEP